MAAASSGSAPLDALLSVIAFGIISVSREANQGFGENSSTGAGVGNGVLQIDLQVVASSGYVGYFFPDVVDAGAIRGGRFGFHVAN